jgi:hypothetical protein
MENIPEGTCDLSGRSHGADFRQVSPDLTAKEIVFLFIGGSHQVFHLAPVAAELSRVSPDTPIVCLTGDEATAAALHRVREVLAAPDLRIQSVRPPVWGRALSALTGRKSSLKGPLLLSLRRRLGKAAVVVTPERTSAVLRRMGLRDTLLIHFRHGAGDRAPESESRLAAFDVVVVPGEKDFRHAIEKGYPADRLRVCGYVKLDFCGRLARELPPFFENGKPTVLYNPHFVSKGSSLPIAEQVMRRFLDRSSYNLIVAPHIRAVENMGASERARWHRLAVPGRAVVDLDSPRLIDMTYTLTADIYLGDLSSQLYEFLIRPRPVAFFNALRADWRNAPRFAGWRLGEVAEEIEDVVGAVDRAVARHPAMIEKQQAAVANAFGDIHGAALRGADIVAAAVRAHRQGS